MTHTIDVRRFRKHLRHFERALNNQNNSACCCGVTLTQCHTLMALDSHDNIPLNLLAEKLYLDKSTVSRTVESLVNQDLVSRETPKEDRRSTYIKLSPKGLEVCKTIHHGNDAYFEEALAAIPADIFPKFIEGFEILVNKMNALNGPEKCS